MKSFKLVSLIFSLLFTISANAQIKEERHIEKNGFEWIELSQNYKFYGAKNENGRTIIPLSRRYSLIYFRAEKNITGYFSVKRNGYEGACDINGNEIIAPNKYDNICFLDKENITGYFSVERNGYKGACDINGKEIIAPNKYDNICFHDKKNITGYFEVKRNGYEGACDINGKEIIAPNKYDDIFFHAEKNITGYFEVERNGYKGACDINGNEIIALNKYDNINFYPDPEITGYFEVELNGYRGVIDLKGNEIISPNKYSGLVFLNDAEHTGYFKVIRNGYEGACDINGNEIIAPNKYKKISFINGKFYNVSNGLNKKVLIKTASSPTTKNLAYNKNTAQATPQATASRQTTTSTNRRPAKKLPLMKGTYIQSGQGYCEETGQYTQGGSDWTCLVEFYDDHITVGGEYCELIKTFNNGTKHYSSNLGKYIVTKNYGMSLVSFGYGYTFRHAMRLKGQLTPGDSDNRDGDIPYQTPNHNSGNGSRNTYTAPSSSGSTRNTTRPRTARRCGACDGKGWIPSTRGVASYGAKDKWCNECDKKVPANHYHETCPSCKGKGSW